MSQDEKGKGCAMELELARAISLRDASRLKELIKNAPSLASLTDASGRTALILAAANGWPHGVQELLAASNAGWEGPGGSAFHEAVRAAGRRQRTFTISRSLRAILKPKEEHPKTEKHGEEMSGLEACCELLATKEALDGKSRAGQSPLLFACSELALSHPELLGRLIPFLASAKAINGQDSSGDTPLILAARGAARARGALIEALLDSGADPRMANSDGQTALMAMLRGAACQQKDQAFERLLAESDLLAKTKSSKMSVVAFAGLHQRDVGTIFKVLSAAARSCSREIVQKEIEEACALFSTHPGFVEFPSIAHSWAEREDLSENSLDLTSMASKGRQRI